MVRVTGAGKTRNTRPGIQEMWMKRLVYAAGMAAICMCGVCFLAAVAQGPAPASTAASFGPAAPEPGIFTVKRQGERLHLTVSGHSLSGQKDAEMYLAYQAAAQTLAARYTWFTFIMPHAKGSKLSVPKPDPEGIRYSFRMEFFRPAWRYKTATGGWKSWNPSAGTSFLDGTDPAAVTQFEITADVQLHNGIVDDANPLAFDGSALSDFLINQVSPPK
jgi:hypothetical protein